MRVTSAVIHRELRFSYYKMFSANASVCSSRARNANVGAHCARSMFSDRLTTRYEVMQTTNSACVVYRSHLRRRADAPCSALTSYDVRVATTGIEAPSPLPDRPRRRRPSPRDPGQATRRARRSGRPRVDAAYPSRP